MLGRERPSTNLIKMCIERERGGEGKGGEDNMLGREQTINQFN
jgi:hypothetical protein